MPTLIRRVPVAAMLAAALISSIAGVGQAALVLSLDSSNGSNVLNASDNPASHGEAIAHWLDATGAPLSATAQTGNPVYDIDGGPLQQPVIDFSTGSGARMITTDAVQARTISMVHRWDTTPIGGSYLFDLRAGIPNSYVWQGGWGANWTVYVNSSSVPASSIGQLRNDTWQTTTFVGTSTESGVLNIFSRFENNEFGLGKVAEIRIYDTALTEAERLAVVDELAGKWLPPIAIPQEVLIPIASATASSTSINTAEVLIINANGRYDYEAPNPSSGGGGTSWHTGAGAGTWLIFDFEDVEGVDELVLWDYYTHSPSDWTVELFSETDATGELLLSHDFSITPGSPGTSTRHVIDLVDTYGVLSAKLTSRNNSTRGGTGLSEVAFVQVPEPSTLASAFILLGLAVCSHRRKRQRD